MTAVSRPPVGVVSDVINQYFDEIYAGTRRGLGSIELAHMILEALELDHTLPVTPNRHLAAWNNA